VWAPRDSQQAEPGPEGPDPSCGSGCDGLHRPYELPELAEAGGLSSVDAEGIRRTVAIAFHETRGRGDTPGEWDRWVAHVLDPIVDWRNVLHAAVRRGLGWAHGHSDYTYTRISRRQASAGQVILPALRRPVPRVGIVVDTSGSVDDGLLAQALGEVDGVLATLGVADPQVTVLAVDAAVQTVGTVRRADAIRLAGGGGTDMSLGIRAAQELRPRVDVIIVLTDGWTGWPAVPAPVPVIAVLIGRSRGELPRTPDWIQRVECVR
jgi:predicted metal-dependent peptidase